MENASDALIMAGSVLLLIIALTVSISSFTNLRVQVDEILSYRDQVQITKQGDEYLQYIKSNSTDKRIVSIETIISALRRIRKEQYTVYICLNKTINNTDTRDSNENFRNVIVEENQATEIKNKFNTTGDILRFTLKDGGERYVEDKIITGILYNELQDVTFEEYIGVYQNATEEGVSDANKETYKIITFVEK